MVDDTGQAARSSARELQSMPQDGGSHRQSTLQPDLEGRTPSVYTLESDPYQLSARLKSPSDLHSIRANTSRKRDGFGPVSFNKNAARAHRLRKFYESQNETIHRMLKPVDEHVRTAREEKEENQLKIKIAQWGSLAANLLLAVIQIYAATSSLSLSLFTTMADSLFDPMSNITLLLSNRAMERVDGRRFPSGKARIETVGNIVFCFLMNAVSWILIVVSIIQLAQVNRDKPFHLPSIAAISVALLTKLGLFFYCWPLRKMNSQMHILWEDHRNDLFINSFGLITSVAGSKLNWMIDPIGAIVLSALISILWLRTAYSEFQLLIGISADSDMLQWITYICALPSPSIFHSNSPQP